jgi:hypothetical protein
MRQMQIRHARRIGAVAAIAAIGATGIVSAGATAGKADHGKTAKIKMVVKGEDLFFKGPKKVEAGTKLDVINKTDPQKIGPHTFTLVEKENLPKTKKQVKDCEKFKSEFCLGIVEDHKVDLKTGKIGKPSIDVGEKGWDKSYGKRGDSWVAEAEGDSQTRKVSAKAGTTLYYFCVVHPFMQGKLKVK